MPTRIIALDPGQTTGWAIIDVENGAIQLIEFGTTKDLTLVEIADKLIAADVIVYEGFWLRPDKARMGHFDWYENVTEQVIGSLRTICKLNGKEALIKQQPSQKLPGYAFAGLTYKKGAKGKHWQDALAHACFYAVNRLKANPVRARSA
jgi:hypothetical protein